MVGWLVGEVSYAWGRSGFVTINPMSAAVGRWGFLYELEHFKCIHLRNDLSVSMQTGEFEPTWPRAQVPLPFSLSHCSLLIGPLVPFRFI